MSEKVKCIICGTDGINAQYNSDRACCFYTCPCCGRYELSDHDILNNKSYIEGLIHI